MEENQELLGLLKSRLKLGKAFAKKPHEDWKKFIKAYNIDSLEALTKSIRESGELRTAMQIPYIFVDVESEQPSIFDRKPELIVKGKERDDEIVGNIADSIYDYQWDKTGLEQEVESAGIYFSLIGFAAQRVLWKTKTKTVTEKTVQPIMDEMGNQISEEEVSNTYQVPIYDDPDPITVDPFKLYFSPESVFSVEGDKIPYMFEEKSLSPEEMRETYGKEVDVDSTMDMKELGLDDDNEFNSGLSREDVKRAKVYEYYGNLPKEQSDDKEWEFEKEYHVVFYSKGILKQEECQYTSKPYRFLGNYGLPYTFYKFGEGKALYQLERELSKRRSQMVDYGDRFANPKTVISLDTKIDEKAWKDPTAGSIARYSGQVPPQYVDPPKMPDVVNQSSNEARGDLQLVSRQLDISKGGMSSTVKTATGQTIFAQAAEKKYNRAKKKIGRFLQSVVRFMIEMGIENYDDEKIFLITDNMDQANPMVMSQIREKMKGLGSLYDIQINTESVSVNKDVIRAQAIELYEKTKGDPMVNQMEIIKNLFRVGFDEVNPEKYLNKPLLPPGTPIMTPDGQQFIIGPDGQPQPPQMQQEGQQPSGGQVLSSPDQVMGSAQRL